MSPSFAAAHVLFDVSRRKQPGIPFNRRSSGQKQGQQVPQRLPEPGGPLGQKGENLLPRELVRTRQGVQATGLHPHGNRRAGRGADGDIVVSSTKAYLNALNRLLDDKQERRK